ncbi:DUF3307 domain-containing protein [Mangrovihabitans endophyticus]|uniref:DUF3307 domain-containing protein n=1 Tax=Mangrovihabitans endophyticus TaxID=1751298 RepID=A0A8J3C7X0_9ACTN|nr:DUF3307 domain-containing protein [Mangrovihabitans endophyticus]GGL17764.1 hypothetical protein GCM10012284_60480 [Mangrovihabitans endophyticus]
MSLDLTYSTATALAFLGTLAALGAGHLPGDIAVQSNADATGKAMPGNDRLAAGAHPWTGWGHCARHTLTYLACQAVAVFLVLLVVPVPLPGAIAALAFSGATHAVIDRRWLVARLLAAKGCTSWKDMTFWADQSLHWAAMFLAALIAARTHTFHKAGLVAGFGVLLIAYALFAEHRHARGVAAGPAPTDRL